MTFTLILGFIYFFNGIARGLHQKIPRLKLKIVPESCDYSLAPPLPEPCLSLDANPDDPPCRPALKLLALGNQRVS